MVEDIKQEIWSDWYNKQSNCKKCDAHDELYKPRFGGGTTETNVMMVLRDPNNDRGPGKEDYANSEERPQTHDYEVKEKWDSWTYIDGIASRIDGLANGYDLYLTNVHKCPKQGEIDFNPKDTEKVCRKYIKEEISYIEPKVIIALSRESINTIGACPDVNFSGDKGPTQYVNKWIFENKRYYGEDPSVVAGIHPSGRFLKSNLRQAKVAGKIGEQKENVWYYDQVSRCVNQALSEIE